MTRLPYPAAPRGEAVDEYHGERIADPYRVLEDSDGAATVAWVTAENALTERLLATLPDRDAIRHRITGIWDHPKAGVPFERGGKWFHWRNPGLLAQAVLRVAASPTEPGRVLIDPNLLSPDGTVALNQLTVSDDGRLAAYATSAAGSDWVTWRVRDVDTGVDRRDVIEWSKFSDAAWRPDGAGFYYTAMDQPPAGREFRDEVRTPKIMFHRLSTRQADDSLVFSCPDQPDWLPSATVSDDGRYLIVTIHRGTGTESRVLVQDLEVAGSSGALAVLVSDFSAKAVVIGNADSTFFLLTDRGAERGKVVAAELGQAPDRWRDVVSEAGETLLEAHLYGGRLVCHYLRDAHSALRVHDLDGATMFEVDLRGFVSLLPDPFTGRTLEGRPESPVVRYQIGSFTESGALWALDLATGETTCLRASTAPIDPAAYVTEQIFAPSDDGTLIPVFVTRARDATPSADRPALLYGYGGFDIPLTPSFSVTFAAWLDQGGTLAVANLRGGGEFGRPWHDGGRLANKQNVFDDFCGCARWLSESGWSRPGLTAIYGGSNGGLLVGACLTQRPELFGAAIADVGVFDMLRFDQFTIGWAWKSDYGDPGDPEQYQWLRAYSPLHNVRSGVCYPATMILTGDHDDRVVPGHSYKFAATLQDAQACEAPVLLRVETSAGHGAGKPTAKLIAEAADRLAFLKLALH
jgi:prolyl oligopeptidase